MSTAPMSTEPLSTAAVPPAIPTPPAGGHPPGPPADAAASRRVAFQPMAEADLDAVCEVDKAAYTHAWSRRHFADSLAAGYHGQLLLGEAAPGDMVWPERADGRWLLGYLVAMPGVDEAHLLNLTVAPPHQRQGWARCLLDALVCWCREREFGTLWLEVRASNTPARALYTSYGFHTVGQRRGYYPAGHGEREDAIVMSLPLAGVQLGQDR